MAAMEKNNKNLNVPNLRFPEFSGEWDITTIGEISNIKNGPFGSVLHAEDYVSDGIPIVTTEHFKSGSLPIVKDGIPQVSEQDYIRLKGYKLQTNDIVISRVGSVDINAYVSDTQNGWLFSGRVLRVRPISSVNSLCLHFVLSTEKVKQGIRSRAVGQTMPSINTPILSTTNIFLPKSLEEQRKISIFLALIDARLETQKKIIEDLKKLKDAISKIILSCSDLLEKRVRISEIGTLKNGYAFQSSSYDSSGKYEIITIANVTGERYICSDGCNHIPAKPSDIQPHQELSVNDILISLTGNVGRVSLCKEGKFLLNQRVGLLELHAGINREFVYQVASSRKFKQSMISCSQGAAQMNVGKGDVESFVMPYSSNPLNLQRIASILRSYDELIIIEEKRLRLLLSQKQYLISAMFI